MYNNFKMKSYFFETYGCEMNIAESAAVEQLFIARGWQRSESAQTADVAVINTCSIRETAENRILGRLGWFSGLKAVRECKLGAKTKMLEEALEYVKDGPKPLTLIVMGCMAERLLKSFQKDYPFIDYVVGTYAKHHFSEIISAVEEGRKPFELDDSEKYRFASLSAEPGAFSTFVPIMHGCNNFCTYCIVPYARGRERSRDFGKIVSELETLKEQGYKEVMLLGQNVNSYGLNNEEGKTFKDVLEAASDIGFNRVRFMSSHPKDLSDEVIDLMADRDNIEKHLHLAMQSGSNRILKLMNRPYTIEQFLDIAYKFRSRVKEGSLTTDIIVGFPGETEEDFEQTLDAVRKAGFDAAFTFQYSPRPGTKAASFDDQVPKDIVSARFDRLLKLQNDLAYKSNEARVGRSYEVLIEGISKAGAGTYTARTLSNHLVNFTIPEDILPKGCLEDLEGRLGIVKIERARPYSIDGVLERFSDV